MKRQQKGFTLVELSIVLVILGLLVGGVLTGQSLIRAAELRSVSTQYNGYITAVQTFRDKYFALPGDMPNATAYWGILAGNGSDTDCVVTETTGIPTCNGDGDGTLKSTINAGLAYEDYRFWQHLANAGLIEGNYSSVPYSPVRIGKDAPAGKLSGTYFIAQTMATITSTPVDFPLNAGNTLLFRTIGSQSTRGSLPLKPEEAYNIDMKMDDGMPGTGKVRGNKGSTAIGCSTASNTMGSDATATYNLSNVSKDCNLRFVGVF